MNNTKCDKPASMCPYSNAMLGICEFERNGDCALLLDGAEEQEEPDLDYETTYGHCLAKNPYWFIPDLECNTEKELLSWRHALFAVKQGAFESPEHYFWKKVDVRPAKEEAKELLDECDGVISMMGTDNGEVVIHGHNTPWGMGISAFSDKINVWEEYPHDKWILELAESDMSDTEFSAKLKAHREELERKRGGYRVNEQ